MQQALCLREQYIGKWKESSTRFTPGAVLFATVLGVVVEGVHGVIHSYDTFSLGTWRSATNIPSSLRETQYKGRRHFTVATIELHHGRLLESYKRRRQLQVLGLLY